MTSPVDPKTISGFIYDSIEQFDQERSSGVLGMKFAQFTGEAAYLKQTDFTDQSVTQGDRERDKQNGPAVIREIRYENPMRLEPYNDKEGEDTVWMTHPRDTLMVVDLVELKAKLADGSLDEDQKKTAYGILYTAQKCTQEGTDTENCLAGDYRYYTGDRVLDLDDDGSVEMPMGLIKNPDGSVKAVILHEYGSFCTLEDRP